MKVCVHGLGYVGCVSAACLAKAGHEVVGVDINATKVEMILEGRSPVVEPGLQQLIGDCVAAGRLSAAARCDHEPDVHFVCVGTPSKQNGSLDLGFVRQVAEEIGHSLRSSQSYPVVNVRSTVLPGTVEETVIPMLERHSQKRAGIDFGVCINPEFMREGSSLEDFHHPPFTVIGELDSRSGDTVALLYAGVDAPLIRTSMRSAEMLKYACNAFHALKVSFANEIGNICKKLEVDSHEVMEIFLQDTKLNLSPYYLKPGFAFGGSCLPKDLRALTHAARSLDLELPVLDSIMRSNRLQVETAFHLVQKTGKRRVGLIGLSFKPGSDDLRESPMVELAERLIGKGYELSVWDREVSLARIVGSNRAYIETIIPHISALLKDSLDDLLTNSDLILVAKNDDEIAATLSGQALTSRHSVIDLVRLSSQLDLHGATYDGICW